MILHTHSLLHLYLISIFLYYISLINSKSRFKTEKVSKFKKKAEEETVWQRLTKNLRRPCVNYQDRELLWLGCTNCVNWRYLVRDFHSVRYPVRRKTENRSCSVSLQWYSCLTLNSEHLVGFPAIPVVPILIPRSESKEKHRMRGIIDIDSIIYLLVVLNW